MNEILDWLAYGKAEPDRDGNPIQVQVEPETARLALIELMVELLPKKTDMLCEFDRRLAISEQDKWHRAGWNDAIQTMLERIEGLR